MKRFVFLLIIIVLLAGTGFGFGYVQLRIDASEVGVLFSRTSGWDPVVHRPGELAWRWQLLIPTNAHLYRFPIEPRRVSVDSRSFLPSAELYSRYLEGSPSLDHSISLSVTYKPLPTAPGALAPLGITPETFDDWLDEQDDRISTRAIEALGTAADRGINGITETAQSVHDSLSADNPNLEIISVHIAELHMPDLRLYEAGRQAYLDVQAARRRSLAEGAASAAREESRATSQVDILGRYGAILTEYPVLLEYVRIAAETGADPLEIGLPESVRLPE